MNQSKMDIKRDRFFVYVFILILCLAMSAFTQTGEVVSTLVPDTSQVCIGDTLSVIIQIDMTGADVPNNNLGSFTGSVMWDSTKLVYLEDTGIGAGFTGNTNLADTNKVIFNGANPAGVDGIVDITSLTFEVVDTGNVFLDLEYSAMAAAQTFTSLMGILTVRDTTITSLAQVTLTLAVNPEDGGTSEPEAGVHFFTVGSEIPVSATPAAGFYFIDWTGDVADTGATETTILLDGDKTITANFGATHTLTIEVLPDLDHGSTDPPPGAYEYTEGTDVTLIAIPNRHPFGAIFVEWQGDASGVEDTVIINMDSDKDVTAVFVLPDAVGQDTEILPDKVALYQNYPNPFNPETRINFDIPASSSVMLEIYNINGQKVRTLFNGIKPAGRYTEIWNGTNDAGKNVTSGVYLLRMKTDQITFIKRMFLLR